MHKYHQFSTRVYIEDTDAAGLVYHANYLKFAERARTEFLRELGISHAKMIQEQGFIFVLRSCYLNYLAPAHLDDVLEIRTSIKKLGYAKLDICQAILRKDQVISTLDVVLACLNASRKPVKLDPTLRQLLITYDVTVERKL